MKKLELMYPGFKEILETRTSEEIKNYISRNLDNAEFDRELSYSTYAVGLVDELGEMFFDVREGNIEKNKKLNKDYDLAIFLADKTYNLLKKLIEFNPNFTSQTSEKMLEKEKIRLQAWQKLYEIAVKEKELAILKEEYNKNSLLQKDFTKSPFETLEEYHNSLKEESSMGHR